ncbi:hypothetical protein PR048_014363 [Dryococelus australis]|uniref:Interleukin-1 beta n=1 Tax=Dryococelus australis TaxID=614101 RepID=A0ABQ9HE09_9NEOP|nr:hypothetical protein PR048_014363 [Dryococelus australis]
MCNAMEDICEMMSQMTKRSVDNYSINISSIFETHRTMDRCDSRILQDWLEIHSPFQHEHSMQSLSSGLSADSRVNCDVIMLTELAMVGKTFVKAKISRKARINSLSVMHNTVTINNKVVPISENQLFMRIVCIMKSDTEKVEYLKYELFHSHLLFLMVHI